MNIWGYNSGTNSYTALPAPESPASLLSPALRQLPDQRRHAQQRHGHCQRDPCRAKLGRDHRASGPIEHRQRFATGAFVARGLPNNGGYTAGPDTIAVINNVEPGTAFLPLVKPAAKPAPIPAAKPAATTAAAKPATATAIKSAAAVVSSGTNKNATSAAKPLSNAYLAALGKQGSGVRERGLDACHYRQRHHDHRNRRNPRKLVDCVELIQVCRFCHTLFSLLAAVNNTPASRLRSQHRSHCSPGLAGGKTGHRHRNCTNYGWAKRLPTNP